ncbi:hypothetical protein [Bacillus solitudinis]|uniref:hypothetical protein n=1 Tax=Bacillus solitudinis TaxID=2014074 RepID=UPI000C232C05|nr:hypothetical protein [Bacillus solitudinis]
MEAKEITVEKRTDEGSKTIKVLDNTVEFMLIEKKLGDTDWEEKIEVSMALPPEYRFSLNLSNYAIWVTPNGDRLEIVIEGEEKYINLPEKSQMIYLN